MKRLQVFAAALLVPTLAPAAQQELLLEPAMTDVSFDLEATGHDVHGLLALESGRIEFDPVTGTASGSIVIDAAAAATGNSSRDRTMRSKVLEVARFPRIEFSPAQMTGDWSAEGASEITLHGILTLLGETHPLALPAQVEVHGNQLTADVRFTVPYQDWGLHDPSILFLRVARVVAVTVHASGELRPAVDREERHGR